ncbi:hypothetical protein IWQ61_005311 [Dispira simplex]|nr:hypothetical protein IWQ61_005311 [Dispira simplex]
MYTSHTAKVQSTKLACFSTVAISFAVVAAVFLLSPPAWYIKEPYGINTLDESFMTVWPWLSYPPFEQNTHVSPSVVQAKQGVEEQVVKDRDLSTLYKMALKQRDPVIIRWFNYRVCESLLYDLQQWETLNTTSNSGSELFHVIGKSNLSNTVLLALLGANSNAYQVSSSLLLYETFDPILDDLEVKFSQLLDYIKHSHKVSREAQGNGVDKPEVPQTPQPKSPNVVRYWRKLLDISKKDTLGAFPDVKEAIEALADYATHSDDVQPPGDYHTRPLQDAMYSIQRVVHEPSTFETAWEPYNRLADHTRFLLSPLHYVTEYAPVQDLVNLVSWVGQTVFSRQGSEGQSTRHDYLHSVFSTYTLPVIILTIVAERGADQARTFIHGLHQAVAQREWTNFLNDSGPAYDSFLNYIEHTLVYQGHVPFGPTLPNGSEAARLYTSLIRRYGKMYELRTIPDTAKYELYLVWSKKDYNTRVLWANQLQRYRMTHLVRLRKDPPGMCSLFVSTVLGVLGKIVQFF